MQFNIRVSSTGKMEKESQNKRCFDLIHVYLSVNTPHFHNQLSFQTTSDKKKKSRKKHANQTPAVVSNDFFFSEGTTNISH